MFENFTQKYGVPLNVINGLYNPAQKISFIEEQYGDNERENSIDVKVRFFSNIGEIEKQKNKDLMNFNIVEIESVFFTMKIAVRGTFYNRKNIIKKYFEWCIRRGYISFNRINMFDDLTFDHIFDNNNLTIKYFKNLDSLMECLNTIIDVYSPYDKHRYDTIICAILLIWCGLPIEDICHLKIEAMDFKNHIIKLNKQYKMPQFINDFIENYLSITSYAGNVKSKLGKVYYYKETGYVLRTTTNSNILCYSKGGLQSRISTWFTQKTAKIDKNNKYYGHSLYLKDVCDSGFFNRLYEYENQYNIEVEDLDNKIFLNLRYKDDIAEQYKNKLIDNYKLWKQTFYGI